MACKFSESEIVHGQRTMVFANLLAVTIPQILEKDTNEQGKMAKGHPIKIFSAAGAAESPTRGLSAAPAACFYEIDKKTLT